MDIRVIIVDDEEDSVIVLQTLLKRYCANVTVVETANDLNDAYDKITRCKPQAVFLDVQMYGGTGFDLLKKFDSVEFEVVFVTSYDKYVMEAMKLSALHYLLKPIEVEDLQVAVKRIERNAHWRELQNEQFRNAISNMEGLERRIALHVKGKVEFVKLSEITHLESDRNYTVVYTKSNKKLISSKNLGEYEEMLKEYDFYYRVNKGCIVNMNYVEGYSKGEPCIIDLMNNYKQEVSRAKKQELLQLLKLKPR